MERRRGSAFMLFLLIYIIAFNNVFRQVVIPQISAILERSGNNPDDVWNIVSSPWFVIFQQLVGLILPLSVWLYFRKEKLLPHLPSAPLGKVNLTLVIFLSIFLQPALMFISGLTGLFVPNQAGAAVMDMMAHPYLLLILALAVAPAFCEEIVFRGYIQSAYRQHSFKKAALINGLFFAIIHLSLQQFFYAFAAGVIFAYMVHYTRSIRAGIIAHFIMNASQITLARVISYVLDVASELGIHYETDIIPEMELAFGTQLASIMSIGLVALLATPCAIILFNVFLSHNRQRNMESDMKHLLDDESDYTLIESPETPADESDTSNTPNESDTSDSPNEFTNTPDLLDPLIPRPLDDEYEGDNTSVLLKYIDPFLVGVVVLYVLRVFFL